MTNERSRNSFLISSVFLLLLIIVCWWGWSSKEYSPPYRPGWTFYYRGFGLNESIGAIGRNYYFLKISSPDISAEVYLSGEQYSDFKRYYPDGKIREEGACLVEYMGSPLIPVPLLEDVDWSKSYAPDGSLIGEVKNGTGKSVWVYPDGSKQYEVVWKDHKRTQFSSWYRNGQLYFRKLHSDGVPHGLHVSYYPSGEVKSEGKNSHGFPVGKWTEYLEDGTVKEVIDHGLEHTETDAKKKKTE